MKEVENTYTTLSIAAFWNYYDQMNKLGYTLCSYGVRKTSDYVIHHGIYRKLKNNQK